jgi:hypothetical protein
MIITLDIKEPLSITKVGISSSDMALERVESDFDSY